MSEQNLPPNTLRNADGTAYQAVYDENVMTIEQEIAALEREASYELNSSETRYIAEVKAYLLRNGYRFQPTKEDPRILAIIHLASGKIVYQTTDNELRYARLGKDGWLRTVRYQQYYIAERLEK